MWWVRQGSRVKTTCDFLTDSRFVCVLQGSVLLVLGICSVIYAFTQERNLTSVMPVVRASLAPPCWGDTAARTAKVLHVPVLRPMPQSGRVAHAEHLHQPKPIDAENPAPPPVSIRSLPSCLRQGQRSHLHQLLHPHHILKLILPACMLAQLPHRFQSCAPWCHLTFYPPATRRKLHLWLLLTTTQNWLNSICLQRLSMVRMWRLGLWQWKWAEADPTYLLLQTITVSHCRLPPGPAVAHTGPPKASSSPV